MYTKMLFFMIWYGGEKKTTTTTTQTREAKKYTLGHWLVALRIFMECFRYNPAGKQIEYIYMCMKEFVPLVVVSFVEMAYDRSPKTFANHSVFDCVMEESWKDILSIDRRSNIYFENDRVGRIMIDD